MKLFQLYKSIIDKIKPVEIAWFTTFNLDIDLTERFLLSTIAGKEPGELNTAEDYEALNLELQNIDIRIWYDYRAMDRRKGKRTIVDMISVDPRVFYDSPSREIVFHPKVIFLSGKGGAYLISGSANLTIAAWSTNKEGIVARQICSSTNANEIVAFFQRLINIGGVPGEKNNFLRKWSSQFEELKTEWSFFHSFSKELTLFERLHKGALTIWSPYFSKRSSTLLQQLTEKGFSPLTIAPDILESGKVRIIPEELDQIRNNPLIVLKSSKESGERETNVHRLAHAKVWLTPDQLAVGSWNCSFRATGMNTQRKDQNIEGGFVMKIQSRASQTLLSTLNELNTQHISGTEESDLEKEWEDVLSPFTIECKIIANWENFTYSVICNDPTGLTVILPDRPAETFLLALVEGKSFVDHYTRVLKSKYFAIQDQQGNVVFAGFLLETGKRKRQAYSYTNFFDVFDSLIADPTGETHRKMCQYKLDEEEGFAPEDNVLSLNYRGHESYYMMFVAFQRLYEAMWENQHDHYRLDLIGFRLPGSLTRISELFRDTTETLRSDPDADKQIFYYFLGMEINRCIQSFNALCPENISELEITFLFKASSPTSQDHKFLQLLKSNFGYES